MDIRILDRGRGWWSDCPNRQVRRDDPAFGCVIRRASTIPSFSALAVSGKFATSCLSRMVSEAPVRSCTRAFEII
jgi:hypothetical protein